MFNPDLHGLDHVLARLTVSDPPCAANIDTNAVGTNQVSVKGNDFVVLHDTRPAFLKPGVGARARGQEPRLDPFATTADVFCMQDGPNIIL